MRGTEFLWRTRETAVQRLVLAPLLLAEGAYRVGTWLHRRAFELGLRPRAALPSRVVAIGNLTVGGSGKTPLVAWIAAGLSASGRKVAVLCRGVRGGRAREVNVVSDGERVLVGPEEVGDEPLWIAGAAPGVPVLAGRNRFALGLRAAALFGSEVLLLDDGFQHWRLERDLDLVCVDARLGLGNGHVLPRGPLREPPSGLARADAIVITRAQAGGPEPPGLHGRCPGVPRFSVEFAPRELRELGSGERHALDRLRGRRVGLLAGIARPDRLSDDLGRLGARVEQRRLFADHHPYRRDEIASLDRSLPWVTTAKDAVKIPADWTRGRRIWVLEEEVRRDPALPLLEWLGRRLDAPRSPR